MVWPKLRLPATICLVAVVAVAAAWVSGTAGTRADAAAAEPWVAKEQPDLKAQIEGAAPLETEDVCIPVTSVRRGELMWVPNPDGKTYDLLQWYFRDYSGPTTVFIMDLRTGEIKQDGIPLRRQIHICGKALGPDGRLYLATPDWKQGMEIYVYDPASNELSSKGVVVPRLAGEKRDLVVAPDGKIYGTGSYAQEKKAGAYQLDPETGQVTDYGPLGPSHAPNGCWGYSIAADERYVYVASGKIPWYLVAYHRETKRDTVLLTTESVGGFVGVRQHRYGCSAHATKVVGTDGKRVDYWLYQGKAIPKKEPNEPPPWSAPEEPKPWVAMPAKPDVYLENATPAADGSAEIWYRPRGARVAAPADAAPDASPEDLGWRVVRLQVPTYPMVTYRLVELPDGRLLGTAGAYEGNFVYDPAAGTSVHLGKIPLSHYATAIAGGQVYMSGYPSSPLYVFDPAKPWTAERHGKPGTQPIPVTDESSNPRRLAYMNEFAGTHKMYAAAVGADGSIYFGGRWIRNGSAGGLAWWDPEGEKAGGFWEAFSNYQINFMTAAEEGRYIVISTMGVRDDLLGKPTPKQGKLFVFDTAQGEIVREVEPVPNVKGTGLVAGVGGTRVLGMTSDPEDAKASILYGVDVATGEVAFRKSIPWPLAVSIGSNQKEAFDYRVGPDGKVWTFIGGALVRIAPGDASIEVVGKVRPGGRIAFYGRDIYLSGTEHLRRIRNIAPLAETH